MLSIQEFIRVPHVVVAMQYFNGANLPSVTPIYKNIDNQESWVNGTQTKSERVIVGGKCMINGKPWAVEPSDYIIYDKKSMEPLQCLSEAQFASQYVSTKVFSLCDSCLKNAEDALVPQQITSIDQIRDLLREGRGPVPMTTPNGQIWIYTYEQLLTVVEQLKASQVQA